MNKQRKTTRICLGTISLIVPILDTSQLEILELNDLAPENISFIVVALDVFHDDKTELNSLAPENIPSKFVTNPVSHEFRSSLKVRFTENKYRILVTLPTHQEPIGHPYTCVILLHVFPTRVCANTLVQSLSMYSSTASFSSPRSAKH